jgi:hypothetical protein
MRESLAIVFLIACSSERPPPLPDAGGGADAAPTPADPAAPAPPLAPSLAPCPAGWNETPASKELETPVCDPWTDTPLECAGLTAQFLTTGECTPIGDACPAGDYATPPPGITPLYLRAGASGDGTLARPFGSLTEAIARAPEGAVVLLAAGDYRGPITTTRSLTLVGACPERTRIVGDTPAYLTVASGELTLRNLHVAVTRGTMLSEAGATLALDSVAVTGLSEAMIGGIGPVVVRDSLLRSGAPDGGEGIGVLAEGPVTVQRSVLRGFPEGAIVVYGASSVLTVEDSVLGARIEGDVFHGGRAIQVTEGAVATVERCAFDLPGDAGLYAEGGTATLRHVVIEELRSRAGAPAAALLARGGSTITAERVWLLAPNGSALRVFEPMTHLTMRDSVVTDTWGGEVGAGFGAEVSQTASIELERVIFDGTENVGVAISDGSAVLRDLTVRRTLGSSIDGDGGFGIVITSGSSLQAERIELDRNRHAGLVVVEAATATIADLRVTATEPSALYGTQGHGAYFSAGATVAVERALFERNHEIGISAFDETTSVELRDLRVASTIALACEVEGCVAPRLGGIGIGAYGGGRLTIERFAIEEHELAGAQIAFGSPDGTTIYPNAGIIDLAHGTIARNPIGVNVQDPSFELDRLFVDVAFTENDRNVDAANLGIPRPPAIAF